MEPDFLPGSRGRVLFFILLVLVGCSALFYSSGSGSMGIEERFSSALGITPGQESHGEEEVPGFSLEGHPLLYGIVLVLLGVMCWIVYRKFGV